MEKTRKNKGITLVALVITIIILLILAGVSITALTKSDLLENAKMAKNATENAQNTENIALADYQEKIDQYIESGRDVALSDEVKSYIDNKISEVEKVEITDLVSDWVLKYNNSVKKGNMVYLEFALSKQTSWSNGWNNDIAKIPVLSNENTYELTLNAWEGKCSGNIWMNNGNISVYEVGMYGSVENTIVVNATFYIGEKWSTKLHFLFHLISNLKKLKSTNKNNNNTNTNQSNKRSFTSFW